MTAEVKILIVDDVAMNLDMLEVMLSDIDATIIRAENGQEALNLLEQNQDTDAILLDLEMPVMNGFTTLSRLKQSFTLRDIPIIVVTADAGEVTRTLSLGANDFISKPYNSAELKLRLMNQVRSKKLSDMAKDMNTVLESEVAKKTAALQKALLQSKNAEYEISLRLGKAAEFRDQETGMHTRRVSEFSKCLAVIYGMDEEESEILRFASPLHDVGKIGIPDCILLKPGKLDEDEFENMKLHTVIGSKILSDSGLYPVLSAGSIIASQHHEKWNGTGYPSGLKGEAIHIFARIVSIVDVFDALTSERPYKNAFPIEKTIAIMEEGKGIFFDPHLLDLFFNHIDEFVRIKNELKDVSDEH